IDAHGVVGGVARDDLAAQLVHLLSILAERLLFLRLRACEGDQRGGDDDQGSLHRSDYRGNPVPGVPRICPRQLDNINTSESIGEPMKRSISRLTCALLLGAVAFALPALGSSHREALAVLNEPCADNTDTYAWVSDGAHDQLYLIMDFNPLHEP